MTKTPLKLSLKLRPSTEPSSTTATTTTTTTTTQHQLLSPRQTSSSADFIKTAAIEVPRAEAGSSALEALAASALSLLPEQETSSNNRPSRLAHLLPRMASVSPQPTVTAAISPFVEDECIGQLFEPFECLPTYTKYCMKPDVTAGIIDSCCGELSEYLTQSHSITLPHLSSALHRLLSVLCLQESTRTGTSDLTPLLTSHAFLSSVAVLLCWLPRTVATCVRIEELSGVVGAELVDVLLAMESVLRAFPQLTPLPQLAIRLKHLQHFLLEEGIWSNDYLYRLIAAEVPRDNPGTPIHLPPLRSPQKALESLTGFNPGARLSRLELVFRKVLRLACQRIQGVCGRTGVGVGVCQVAWEWFVEMIESEGVIDIDGKGLIGKGDGASNANASASVSDPTVAHTTVSNTTQPSTTQFLLHHNHLNQLLMAILYTVTRLLNTPRTFLHLSSLLPCSPLSHQQQWHLRVSTGDYYTFYNERFLPRMREKIGRVTGVGGKGTWAPVPGAVMHQIGEGVSLSVLPSVVGVGVDTGASNSSNSASSTSTTTSTSTTYVINPFGLVPETPNPTTHLQLPSSPALIPAPADTEADYSSSTTRVKRIARRLDFNDDSDSDDDSESNGGYSESEVE